MVQVGWKFKTCLLLAALLAEWAKRNDYLEYGAKEVFDLKQVITEAVGLIPDEWADRCAAYLNQLTGAIANYLWHLF